jgi:TfoX/Sxy family transcriptional regulator of competence genes
MAVVTDEQERSLTFLKTINKKESSFPFYILLRKNKIIFLIMAYNEKLTEKVREALSQLPKVEEKRMFRGVAFMVNDKMCISAGNDELMVRIDPSFHEEALKKKGTRPVIMKGHEYKGYVYVNEKELKSKKDFEYWINLALKFNKIAKSSRKAIPSKKRHKR